jgi:hypothetical protein
VSPDEAACQTRGADAFIDGVMPVIRAVANETRDPTSILMAYSGCLGALFGSMVADMGQDYALRAFNIMSKQIAGMAPLERMQ